MEWVGNVKSYSHTLRKGHLALEGYEDILFHLKDVPQNNIAPKLGEIFHFQLAEEHGKIVAKQIQREHFYTYSSWHEKLRARMYHHWIQFLALSRPKQRLSILVIALVILGCIGLICYATHHFYTQYQAQKAERYVRQYASYVQQQKALHGELPEQVLSEDAKRNLDGNVYGTSRARSENVTHSIDKLNGRLPVEMGQFKCDGRYYCSEMRSLAESQYFHRHCRETRLDGNGNRKPCENDARWQ